MANQLTELLNEKGCLLADGATGTNYFQMGLQTGDSPELWNREHRDRVAESYKRFIDAGSDIVLTNSFGGTSCRLKLHKLDNAVDELNEQAVVIARAEVEKSGRKVLVAGSMGPTGEILEPVGTFPIAEAEQAFAQQALALERGGADLLWIETLSSMEEVQAAIAGASKTNLPIVCTMSFDTNGRTMMGVMPSDLARYANEASTPLTAYGSNCGVGPAELVASVLNMKDASGSEDIIIAKGNCGIPEYVDGAIKYNGTPELMADYVRLVVAAGARIVGGCCGTTPEHIAVMRQALDSIDGDEAVTLENVVAKLGEISTGSHAQNRKEYDMEAGSASGAPRVRRSRRKASK
ncbi:betaine--homocysteine S-methyltransferase [Porticoccus sp. W117]|uniref:betaine--homocysteine S-methyltransferase n=1 Tax=Porticoccus sp. W117 TaxID=3054777 RepID=UPI002599A529|nr:betaine--homocysteine S-methyltransferase [Porticoccus sp. W117]MDM3871405.1 betaine--homocysteine S-methyltransferase [Porticoccus sp. W117]